MNDEHDTGYYADTHDLDRDRPRRVYLSDAQRALVTLETCELEALGMALVDGNVFDRQFQVFELLPVLEGRWGRE